jgi:tRNA(Leu) C34 or U34 (ribose-2'-O)-methylase TrmL
MKENPVEFELGENIQVSKDEIFFTKKDTPSIVLINPKYPHNVGAALRACSCFGAKNIIFTGDRVSLEPKGVKGYRLPREERMKGYSDVKIINDNYPFNRFPKDVVPIAVEVRDNSERLQYFDHPRNAIYVFGPEDGSIPQIALKHCHRFLLIPSKHCLNLAAAVYLILYKRAEQWGFPIT